MSELQVDRVQVEHLRETLGIGIARPRLSWQLKTDLKNWEQSAYEIACFDAKGQLKEGTGRVVSSQSVLVDWPFAALQSREQVSLRVRVWGSEDSASDWSELLQVEAGLLQTEDWQASFITPDWEEDTTRANPLPYFRLEFDLDKPVESARLYLTALGVYEAQLNGQVIGDQVLAPGWTVYEERLRYQTFDVTKLLSKGKNALGACVGEGWYRGRLGFGGGRRNIYGDKAGLLAQLEVQYQDGSSAQIITGESWRAATGPILSSSIYDGETYDARLELKNWSQAGFDDRDWSGVRVLELDLSILEAPLGPPVRRQESLAPVAISKSPSGKILVDFGQNLVGRLSISVQGEAGHTVTLRHAEVLENGELGIRPLRFAEATDRYTLSGEGIENYEPRFTFHGFRYVEVENWPGELQLSDLVAVVLHSDMERTGWFDCSDPMLNKLHDNVIWGMRGNFLDVPTDCPQRDERMGWTGDIQVFTPTASFLYDSSGFLASWLADLAIEQRKADGAVPHVVPNILSAGGAAAWGDAAVIVPWVLYKRYGDLGILETQFESMRSWVDHVAKAAGDNYIWDTDFQFGDWLDPSAPPDKPFLARTDKAIVATAYFAYSARLVAQTAALLNREKEKSFYDELAENAKNAFRREFVTPAGRLMNDAETAYALALVFDLLSAEQRQHAGDRLAALVRDGGYHIRTGFVGTPLICDALSMTGHYLTAYRLLKQQSCPSWLYPVTMGATTVWERWDSMLPDGSINPGEMTSFNHYALGSVADWMHRVIGGLAPAEPGYQDLRFAPRPGGELTHCATQLATPYGLAACTWSIADHKIDFKVTIPPNTRAQVSIPGTNLAPIELGSGQYQWSADYKDPDARGPFTLDDSVGELMLDASVWERVLDVLSQADAPPFLPAVMQNEKGMSLRKALHMLPDVEKAQSLMLAALENFAESKR
ncbi:MAG: family 78 glycoside hydrolase catalytic domain [Trueperaceae bacterium]|nr:family 78 glycoside hydrolase catalytic domain [Trueperaceae bacterium]